MSKKIFKFPQGFLWGAATAAHQVEGNNTNSDWWAWEHSFKRENQLKSEGKDPKDYYSGIACDSYNRYEEDFTLAEHLGHNAHRLSIEWARIEPEEGKFDEAAEEHYEKVLQSAKSHGLTTFVTLHHYTNPKWFSDNGGFTKKDNVQFYLRFARHIAKRLNQYTDFWITFNEPEIYATHSYLLGIYPPQHTNISETYAVIKNIIKAHNLAGREMHFLSGKPVGMAYHLSDIQPTSIFSSPLTYIAHYMANEFILNRTIHYCDFIGVNYYTHKHIGVMGPRKHSHSGHETSDLGWGIHPEGMERVLMSLKKYKKPIYITENGLEDAQDTKREKFIKDHLKYIHNAIEKGVDVKGYLHWALLDNFEWEKGFGPRFGLIEIDREDLLRRKVRYSATQYAKICETNILEI
jgi:beta-glucosidase